MARLRRSDCTSPGISRRRRGRGFEYLDADGRHITDAATLERIRALALPPAWTGVWICSDPQGHLQAVGADAGLGGRLAARDVIGIDQLTFETDYPHQDSTWPRTVETVRTFSDMLDDTELRKVLHANAAALLQLSR